MAIFYFDTYDDEDESIDDLGVECGSLKAIRDAAVGVLPEMAHDELPDGLHRTFRVCVRDEQGHRVFEAKLMLTARWVGQAFQPPS